MHPKYQYCSQWNNWAA